MSKAEHTPIFFNNQSKNDHSQSKNDGILTTVILAVPILHFYRYDQLYFMKNKVENISTVMTVIIAAHQPHSSGALMCGNENFPSLLFPASLEINTSQSAR
jgi:hypothetical protein